MIQTTVKTVGQRNYFDLKQMWGKSSLRSFEVNLKETVQFRQIKKIVEQFQAGIEIQFLKGIRIGLCGDRDNFAMSLLII